MPYDFPTSPTQGDVFTAGAAKWTWNGYAWIGGVGASTGSGTGGDFPEAPIDGQQYGRQDASWSSIVIPAGDWASITGKPATFASDWNTTINKPPEFPSSWTLVTGKPSTYPSDWNTTINKPTTFTPTAHTHDFTSGVTGKPGTYPPTLPIDYNTGISNKPTTFPPELPIGWASISGKPATYPPTLPITITDVTALQGQLDSLNTAVNSKVFKTGDTMSGVLGIAMASPTIELKKNASGQNNQILGYLNALPRWAMSLGSTDGETGANAGSNFYIRRFDDTGGNLDVPFTINRATGQATFTQLVTLPVTAPTDATHAVSKAYVDAQIAPILAAQAATAFQMDVNGDAIVKFGPNIMIRIKPTGLIMTKDDIEIMSVSV